MVPNNEGMYTPLVNYAYFGDWWSLMQPYDDRYYEFFGLLTEGKCRGNNYTHLGVTTNVGKFNRAAVEQSLFKPENKTKMQNETNPVEFNSTAVCYFDDDDYNYHTHGWITLAQLKANKKVLSKLIKKLTTSKVQNDEIEELVYLKAAIKKMIKNTEVILDSHWNLRTEADASVIICFCFDS